MNVVSEIFIHQVMYLKLLYIYKLVNIYIAFRCLILNTVGRMGLELGSVELEWGKKNQGRTSWPSALGRKIITVLFEQMKNSLSIRNKIPFQQPYYRLPFQTIDPFLLSGSFSGMGVNWGKILSVPEKCLAQLNSVSELNYLQFVLDFFQYLLL